jgi:hypothetical protein
MEQAGGVRKPGNRFTFADRTAEGRLVEADRARENRAFNAVDRSHFDPKQ